VQLPYGDGRFAMTVVLPKGSLSDYVAALSDASWTTQQRALSSAEGTLVLPRFKIEYDEKLNDTLKALGMPEAFEDESDFTGMVRLPEKVKISLVQHKTFVEVNEEGTEAAAVTAIGMVRTTSVRIGPPPFYMIVDRPFFVAITDTLTGTVLFSGAINEPK
jgi:serpin B